MREFTVKFSLDDDEMRRLEEASKRYVAKGYTAAGNIENLFDTAMKMGSKSFIEEKLHFLEVNSKGVEPNRDYVQEKLGESQEATKVSETQEVYGGNKYIQEGFKEENKKFAESREFDEWNEKLDRKGVHVRLVFSEEAFEKYLNGANFEELVSELKELQKYDNALSEEQGLQVPPDMLKASFEAYKQGIGMEEIAEQIKEGKYNIPLTKEELAEEKYWAENYFDESLAEGKTFSIYNKETGEKQFEKPLSEFSNAFVFDLEETTRKFPGRRRFEIADQEGNVLLMGDDSVFDGSDGGFQNIKDGLEYQEKTGVTKYELFPTQVEQFQEQAQTRQGKSESGIKNEGRLIKQDIKSHGFKPKPGLVKSISQLNKMTDKSNSVKDISKMYKEKSLQESNPEAQKLVDKIGNELKAQELAKVAPISR